MAEEPAVLLGSVGATSQPTGRRSVAAKTCPSGSASATAWPATCRLFLPKYKSADDDSVFVRALESPRVQRAVEPLRVGSTPFRVEAKQYPWWDERRVIAIAAPDTSPLVPRNARGDDHAEATSAGDFPEAVACGLREVRSLHQLRPRPTGLIARY